MRTKLFVLVVAVLFGATFVTSCGEKKGDEKKTEKKAEKKGEKKKAEEKKAEPKAEEKVVEEKVVEEKVVEEKAVEEKVVEEKVVEEKAVEEKAVEEKAVEEKAVEEKAVEAPVEAPDEADACDAYAKCCMAYADALSKVQGIPESAIEATRQGCKQVEQFKTMGAGAQQACSQAMGAMAQAGEAYKAMPGFVWPEECK